MEYFNNHTRYIRKLDSYAFSDISELPEERRPSRPHSSVDAFDSPSVGVREHREPRQTATDLFHPRSKNYQVEPVVHETPSFSGIWRRLSSAKSSARKIFSSHNLVPRLLPAQLSLDCEREPVGTDTYSLIRLLDHRIVMPGSIRFLVQV